MDLEARPFVEPSSSDQMDLKARLSDCVDGVPFASFAYLALQLGGGARQEPDSDEAYMD